MKHINFIESQSLQISYRIIALVYFAIIVLGTLSFTGVYAYQYWLEQNVTTLDSEVKQLKKKQQEFMLKISLKEKKQDQAEQKTLQGKFSEIKHWSPILREISAHLPPSLWLTSIQGSGNETNSKTMLTIRGATEHTQYLTDYITQLTNMYYIKDPTLTKTSVNKINGQQIYQFTLSCEIAPL